MQHIGLREENLDLITQKAPPSPNNHIFKAFHKVHQIGF